MDIFKSIKQLFINSNNKSTPTNNKINFAPVFNCYYKDKDYYMNIDCDEIRLFYHNQSLYFEDKIQEVKKLIFVKPPINCISHITVMFWNKGERIDRYVSAGNWNEIEKLHHTLLRGI